MSESTNNPARNDQQPPKLYARTAPGLVLDYLITPENLVPPRKPKLQNTVFTSKGGAKLIQPDQEVLRTVSQTNDKLHYFSVVEGQAFRESEASKMHDPEYGQQVIEPLIDQIKSDLPGYPVLSMRGGMASINGTQAMGYGHSTTIPDVTELVSRGGDREDVFNAATTKMDRDTRDISSSLHRVVQYAANTYLRRLEIGHKSPEVADTLFPVISVYDTGLLKAAGYNVWAVMPREGYTASDALLATYVLDCPTL